MEYLTKWGTFIGTEEDHESFISVMSKRESPEEKPVVSTEEKPKKTVSRKTAK